MANYYASCRSNYFKVKNPVEFKEAMEKLKGEVTLCEENGVYCILGNCPDGGGWPTSIYNSPGDREPSDFDLGQFVSQFLGDGEVAIFLETGAEKLRYLVGHAIAWNNWGEYRMIDINQIYQLARELTDRPDDITCAEY